MQEFEIGQLEHLIAQNEKHIARIRKAIEDDVAALSRNIESAFPVYFTFPGNEQAEQDE